MKSQKFLVFAVRCAVLAGFASIAMLPVAAQGMRDQLSGTYFSTGQDSCLVSPAGFTNGAPNNVGAASIQSASVQGTVTFNADGTGTGQFEQVQINHPPAANASAFSNQFSFSFTYTIGNDGTLTLVIGEATGTILTGALKNVTFAITDLPPLTGRVERNGTSISLSNTDVVVETLTLQFPTPVGLQRICHRSRVLIPVHLDAAD